MPEEGGAGGGGEKTPYKKEGVLILRFGTSSGVQPPVMMMMMMMIIVSLTTFSIVIGSRAYLGRNRIYIVIGSLHAYLTRNCRAITWVSNCRSPI